MLGRLFLLFTIVPLIELFLLVELGGIVGTGPTILLVLATGMAGAALAKREGRRVIDDWQQATRQGRLPSDGLLSAALILVGGVMLVTPGVITDFLGMALLIPAARRRIAETLKRSLGSRMQVVHMQGSTLYQSGPQGPGSVDGSVIDVEANDTSSQ